MVFSNGASFVVEMACIVNALSSAASIIFNGLAMFVIGKSPSLHKPAFVLLFALALTDFITGFVAQPLYIWQLVGVLRKINSKKLPSHWPTQTLDYVVGCIRLASITITALLLTAVSIDRCLALYMKTRYRLVATVKRAILASVLLWIGGAGAVVVTALDKSGQPVMIFIFLPTCLFFTLILFIVNGRKLVKQQNTVTDLRSNGQSRSSGNHQATRVDIGRYKAILTSLKYCFLAFLISFLPMLCAAGFRPVLAKFAQHWMTPILSVVVTINLTNSAVNPVLYYWKIPFVRSELKRLFKLDNTN